VKGTGFKDRVETKLKSKEPSAKPAVEEDSALKKKLARGVRAKVNEKKDSDSTSAIQAKSR
jgi:hypothetical protein